MTKSKTPKRVIKNELLVAKLIGSQTIRNYNQKKSYQDHRLEVFKNYDIITTRRLNKQFQKEMEFDMYKDEYNTARQELFESRGE